MTKHCNNCGSPLPKEVRFCMKCGKPSTEPSTSAQNISSRVPGKIILVLAAALTLILGGIFAVNQFISIDSSNQSAEPSSAMPHAPASSGGTDQHQGWRTLEVGRVSIQYPSDWDDVTYTEGGKALGLGYLNMASAGSGAVAYQDENGTEQTTGWSVAAVSGGGCPNQNEEVSKMTWEEVVEHIDELYKSTNSTNSADSLSVAEVSVDNTKALRVQLDQNAGDEAEDGLVIHSTSFFFENDDKLGECITIGWYEGIEKLIANHEDEFDNVSFPNSAIDAALIDEIETTISVSTNTSNKTKIDPSS